MHVCWVGLLREADIGAMGYFYRLYCCPWVRWDGTWMASVISPAVAVAVAAVASWCEVEQKDTVVRQNIAACEQ